MRRPAAGRKFVAAGQKGSQQNPEDGALSFPFPEAPEYGEVFDVAPGVKWTRIPLPYRLDHVNVYLIEDGIGWALIDTGINTPEARAAWLRLFDGPLEGITISRVIVTHHHPDHIGLAGWLCRRFNAPLLTSHSTYTGSLLTTLDPGHLGSEESRKFYYRHGMSEEFADQIATFGQAYLRQVSPLPTTYLRLLHGDTLVLGQRRFRVLSGDGHAHEQILIWCEDEGLFFAADQVLEKITPNIGVWSREPDGDPLGHFMRSLKRMATEMPDDLLVLPGHRRPFYGLHARCEEILEHHEERCGLILEACAEGAKSVDELVPTVFHNRKLTAHEMSFAFGETFAHANRLIRRGDLEWDMRGDRPVCRLPETAPSKPAAKKPGAKPTKSRKRKEQS